MLGDLLCSSGQRVRSQARERVWLERTLSENPAPVHDRRFPERQAKPLLSAASVPPELELKNESLVGTHVNEDRLLPLPLVLHLQEPPLDGQRSGRLKVFARAGASSRARAARAAARPCARRRRALACRLMSRAR
jgi:hypothetical protein